MKKQKKRILVVDDLASDTESLKAHFQECHDSPTVPTEPKKNNFLK